MKKMFTVMPVWMLVALVVAMSGHLLFAQDAPVANDGAVVAEQPAGETAGEAEVVTKTTFLQLLAKGEWFMIPIAACSLLGLTIIIERIIALRKSTIIPSTFMEGLSGVFRDPFKDREAAISYCRSNESPIARVMAVGLRKLPMGVEAVEQGIEDAGGNEIAKLRRNLRLLYGVSAITPMIGLLGTVWGMIEAFREVSESSGLGKADQLAQGIYTALVTTFAGLTVAIPVLVAYYYFVSRIDGIVSEMNEVSEEFIERHLSGEQFIAAPVISQTAKDNDMPASMPSPA